MIETTHGLMDEADLRKTEGTLDDEETHMAWVEYCLVDCTGTAHHSRYPDAPGVFCRQHVHRSVSGVLKRGLEAEGFAAVLGG